MSNEIWRDDESSSLEEPGAAGAAGLGSIWGEEEDGEPSSNIGATSPIDADLWRPGEASAAPTLSDTSRSESERRATVATRRRAGIKRFIVGVVLLVVVAFTADGVFSGLQVKSSLERARGELGRGAESFRVGDLASARRSFTRALATAEEATDFTHRPALGTLASVPELGNDVLALRALASASEFAARAGGEGVQAASAMGAEGESLASAFFFDGRVQIENLERGSPFVDNVADLISKSDRVLTGAPDPRLGPIREVLEQARQRTSDALISARKGSVLFSSLPDLLGVDEPLRYMLVFQALGEARATGGLFGVYGLLNADDGAIRLGKVRSVSDTFPEVIDAVDAPASFERNYGPQYALRQVQQVNVSPNFPMVAEVLLRMYEQETGDRVDGVMAMDPVTLQQLMRGMDPIRSPFFDETITSDNAVKVLMVDSYLDFKDSDKQTVFLADLVGRFWDRLNSGMDSPQTVEGLAEAVRTGHFKMYSRDPSGQRALKELDSDGGLPDHPNVQMIFHSNYSGNKVDYYLRRSTSTTVILRPDGVAETTTSVRLRNTAPDGPASLLLGPPEDLAVEEGDTPGLNRMILNFLLPEGSIPTTMSLAEKEGEPFTYNEGRHVVAWDIVEIPAGESFTAKLTSEGSANISRAGVFTLILQPQTLVDPERFMLRVVAPSGFLLKHADLLLASPTPEIRISGVLDEPKSIRLQLVPR